MKHTAIGPIYANIDPNTVLDIALFIIYALSLVVALNILFE